MSVDHESDDLLLRRHLENIFRWSRSTGIVA